MTDDPKHEKRQARWRRNKQAARARAKPVIIAPAPEFVAKVTEERDRRASRPAYRWARVHPDLDYWTGKSREFWVRRDGWLPFVADVWAATILLEAEYGPGKATPTNIARWLTENGCEHGYSQSSLRPMIYRARPFIAALESAAAHDHDAAYWLPFDADA